MFPRALVRIDNLETKLKEEIPLKSVDFQLDRAYSIDSTLVLPYVYKVGSKTLKLYWEGVLLNNGIDYSEVGASDTLSNTVTLNVALLSNEYLTQVTPETNIVQKNTYSSSTTPVTSVSIELPRISFVYSFVIDGTFTDNTTVSVGVVTNNKVNISLSDTTTIEDVEFYDTDLTSISVEKRVKLVRLLLSEHSKVYTKDSNNGIKCIKSIANDGVITYYADSNS